MRTFDKKPRFGDREERRPSRFADRGERRDERSRRNEMHDVICDKCGKETIVPFKPTNGKPVLCRDCFNGKPSDRTSDRPSRDDAPRVERVDLSEINRKLDKIMQALKID